MRAFLRDTDRVERLAVILVAIPLTAYLAASLVRLLSLIGA